MLTITDLSLETVNKIRMMFKIYVDSEEIEFYEEEGSDLYMMIIKCSVPAKIEAYVGEKIWLHIGWKIFDLERNEFGEVKIC